jgi:hypothetical protein
MPLYKVIEHVSGTCSCIQVLHSLLTMYHLSPSELVEVKRQLTQHAAEAIY